MKQSNSVTLTSLKRQSGQRPTDSFSKETGNCHGRWLRKPKLLLLDETAAGLNPTELDEAIELIRKIRRFGITIIIVEHIMKVIMSISERILAINYGMELRKDLLKKWLPTMRS